MNILMITPYVTITGRKEFERNKTGFGYMVMDIANAISKIENVSVFATDSRGDSFVKDGVNIIQRSFGKILFNIFSSLPFFVIVDLWRHYHMKSGTFVRLLYYWMISGYIRNIIRQGHYDVVHIHGCDFNTELWIRICKNLNQKFVITLHGLNSFSDTVNLEPAGKQYERDFLKRVVEGEIPITVISTGMKRLIEKTYGVSDCKNIIVVCNCFSFSEQPSIYGGGYFNVRQLYNINDCSKVVLCVGNISVRKNQRQLISSFDYLPKELAAQTYIMFLGGIQSANYTIEELSKDSVWNSHFIACGVISKEEVSHYYEQCDAVALMSLSEGFGLSLIEGMYFGKPSMSFTDIDAYEDIYNPSAMIGVEEHSDEAVAKGLEKLLTSKWDSDRIKKYSSKFEGHTMAKQYIYVYKREV